MSISKLLTGTRAALFQLINDDSRHSLKDKNGNSDEFDAC